MNVCTKSLVSIIMPVFNSEKYLREAIDSILQQTYSHWELIVVDDGSNDNSLRIVNEYQQKDTRIRVYINKSEKHGPGAARNIGIDHITGKYTYFIDSDDWIEKEMLEETVNVAEKNNADLVPFGFILEYPNKQIIKPVYPSGNYVYSDFIEIANDIVRGTWEECFELIRTEIIGDIRQNQYHMGEDLCFQMDILCKTKKVCSINKEFYHYRMSDGSVTHTCNTKHEFIDSSVELWKKEKQFLEYCGVDIESQMMKNTAIERYTGCLYLLCKREGKFDIREKYKEITLIGNKMNIDMYKHDFEYKLFHGFRRMMKATVKRNLELPILLLGTCIFKIQALLEE